MKMLTIKSVFCLLLLLIPVVSQTPVQIISPANICSYTDEKSDSSRSLKLLEILLSKATFKKVMASREADARKSDAAD